MKLSPLVGNYDVRHCHKILLPCLNSLDFLAPRKKIQSCIPVFKFLMQQPSLFQVEMCPGAT